MKRRTCAGECPARAHGTPFLVLDAVRFECGEPCLSAARPFALRLLFRCFLLFRFVFFFQPGFFNPTIEQTRDSSRPRANLACSAQSLLSRSYRGAPAPAGVSVPAAQLLLQPQLDAAGPSFRGAASGVSCVAVKILRSCPLHRPGSRREPTQPRPRRSAWPASARGASATAPALRLRLFGRPTDFDPRKCSHSRRWCDAVGYVSAGATASASPPPPRRRPGLSG